MCKACVAASSPLPSRRNFLTAAAVLSLSTGMLGGLDRALAQYASPPNAISGEAALARIMAGNARYVANAPNEKDFSAGRAARALSQYPIAAIVSCADSRVAPEYAFDEGPGELFVVRLAGNFVNDDGLASLEYGTQFLGVPLIMVLGHTNCGAISAAIKVVNENVQLPGHLPDLIASIKPAVESAKKDNASDLLLATTLANVRLNVERLTKDSPVLTGRISEGKLKVVGGIYDLATGEIRLV